MSTDNALDALTARMLEAVKNTRESADSAAASAQQAQKMAEGEMQGTSLTGAEKKLLVQILQRACWRAGWMKKKDLPCFWIWEPMEKWCWH